MKNLLLSSLFTLICGSLSSQNLVKDIAPSDGNTIFKNSYQYTTFPKNDSLMLINDRDEIMLLKTTTDSVIKNTNWNNNVQGKKRAIFKIKDFLVVLTELNNVDYLVKVSDDIPPIIIWTSGGSASIEITFITQIGEKLLFIDNNPNICICSRLVAHTGEYGGGTVIQTFAQYVNLQGVTPIDNKLYFSAGITSGVEPWVSDGTQVGTFQLADLNAGSGSSYPYSFKKFGNSVYFNAFFDNQARFYQTNGTTQGTIQLYNNYNLYLEDFIVKNNEVFSVNNARIIKINLANQTQTELLAFDVFPFHIFILNNDVFFLLLVHNQNTGKKDIQLWKHDGINMNLVKTLQADLYFIYTKIWESQNKVFFEIRNVIQYEPDLSFCEVWVCDGTAIGTKKVSELNPAISVKNIVGTISLVNDFLYFNAYNDEVGYELFKTNGTTINTKLVKNYNQNIVGSWPNTFFEYNNQVYFMANNNKEGRQLWTSDGTNLGTQQVFNWLESASQHNDKLYGANHNFTSDFGVLGNKLLYVNPKSFSLNAFDAINQTDIRLKNWQYLFQDYYNGYVAKRYTSLTKLNSQFLFVENLDKLWKTDGTPNGTSSFYTFDNYYANPKNLIRVGNEVFFTTENPSAFWRTDGTNTGTQVIQYFSNSQYFSPFYDKFTVGNKAYFLTGNELWEVSANSAVLVSSNVRSSNGFKQIIVFNNALYFKTQAAGNGSWSLMKRDLNGNTSLVFNSTTEITDMFVFKNKIYYSKLLDTDYSVWIYATDGTLNSEIPIKMVSDYYGNTKKMNVNSDYFAMILYKNAYGENFSEIWVSDGTSANSKKVIEVPYTYSYDGPFAQTEHYYENSMNVAAESIFLNNKLFFTMYGHELGRELWVMDFSCPNLITLSTPQNSNGRYVSNGTIQLNSAIEPTIKTTLEANNSILLQPGTEIKTTSVFKAEIKGCVY